MGRLLAKLAGAALILGSTSYVGWQVGAQYAKRPQQLRDLQTALAVLQTEIEYGATPLPDALASAARAGGHAVGQLFAETARRLAVGGGISPGEALAASLRDWMARSAIREADGEVLAALVPLLGVTGRADQVLHLELARQRLAGEEQRARDERERYERLARYLGVLSGAALVLILV